MTKLNKEQLILHFAMRTGYMASLPISRLPEMDETMDEWLEEECAFSRSNPEVDQGLLFLSNPVEDLMIATFSRHERGTANIVPPPFPDSDYEGLDKPKSNSVTRMKEHLPGAGDKEPPTWVKKIAAFPLEKIKDPDKFFDELGERMNQVIEELGEEHVLEAEAEEKIKEDLVDQTKPPSHEGYRSYVDEFGWYQMIEPDDDEEEEDYDDDDRP